MRSWLSIAVRGALLLVAMGCAAAQPLPDAASMTAPAHAGQILVLPTYPAAGKRYLVERDGQREVWVVRDDKGRIDFVDEATQRTKASITLGPCFSFAKLPRHDFSEVGKPAYHTAPEDCRVWDGREWTQTYGVQIRGLPQPCAYGARRSVKVSGPVGRRLATARSFVDITGPGVQGGFARDQYHVVYSEELRFFKELSPGYIGRQTVVLRPLD